MMRISYKEETQVATIERFTLSEKLWQFLRFVVVTGLIFAVSFVAINFSAYKNMLASALHPELQQKASEVLTEAAGELAIDESLLLPILEGEKDSKKSFAWLDFPIAPTDNRLVVPRLGKSVPLVNMTAENIQGENWSELEKQIQGGLRQGVVHYPGTATPGQNGNVFITGHSSYYPWDDGQYKDVFALLGQMEIGDEYYVFYDQKKYVYRIREKFEVNPDNVNVLQQPLDRKESTLMTCTPVGTTLRRLIIKADQIV